MFVRAEPPRVPWLPPGPRSDESYLLQNYLQFEWEQLSIYLEWARGLSRTPAGRIFRGRQPVLLRSLRPPISRSGATSGWIRYSAHPLSGRPIALEPVLFHPEVPPPTDRPVILEGVRRLVLPGPRGDFDYAYAAEEWSNASDRAFLPPLPSAAVAIDRVAAVVDAFRGSPTVAAAALRAFAGAPAAGPSGAGLHSTLGAPGIDSATAMDALKALSPLLPPWEKSTILRRSSRYWAGDPRSGPVFAPFSTVLDGIRPHRIYEGHPQHLDISILRAGAIEGPVLRGLLFGGDDPVLRPATEIESLAGGRLIPEVAGPAASVLVMAHALDPVPRDPGAVDAARERAAELIAENLRTFLEEAGRPSEERVEEVIRSPRLRGGILRAAQARARLALRSELAPADILEVGRSFADSVGTITHDARASELRRYIVSEDLAASRRQQDRRDLIESTMRASPGLSMDELWTRASPRGLWKSRIDFESYIAALLQGGYLVDTQGGLFWVE